MNKFITFFLAILNIFALCFSVYAQETNTSDLISSFKELKLDISTSNEIVEKFGKPERDKDKVSLKDELALQSWLDQKSSEKIFRVIEYKKLQKFTKAKFAFLDDKLAIIILDTPDPMIQEFYIPPDDIEELFSQKFKPLSYKTKLPQQKDFEQNSPSELKSFDYFYWYSLIGTNDKSFIVAAIDNYQYITGFFKNKAESNRMKQINANRKYPGFVKKIQIISRNIELKK